MDQFIEEVQDEWRREQLTRLWKQYGNLFITICIAIIVSTIGYALWDNHIQSKIDQQTKSYEQALNLIEKKQQSAADKILDSLINDGLPGYQILAKFKKVNAVHNVDDKLKLLQSIIKDNEIPRIYRNLASYYYMAFKYEITRTTDFIHELKDYLIPENQFYNYFLELKALSYYKLDQFDQVQQICQTILNHKEITPVLRLRMTALSNHLKNTK